MEELFEPLRQNSKQKNLHVSFMFGRINGQRPGQWKKDYENGCGKTEG